MHIRAAQRIIKQIQAAKTPGQRDEALDQFADALLYATEWDAKQWGFDPDRWCEAERVELASRGGRDWPREVI